MYMFILEFWIVNGMTKDAECSSSRHSL